MSTLVTKTSSTQSNVLFIGGGTAWTIVGQGGNVYLENEGQSQYLKFVNWGFDIPRDATLDSTVVTITRSCPSAGAINEAQFKVFNSAGAEGSDQSDHAAYPVSPTAKNYTLTGVLRSDINCSLFGFEVAVSAPAS